MFTRMIFVSTILLALIASGSAFVCHMCNVLMSGDEFGLCTDSKYHGMDCMKMVDHSGHHMHHKESGSKMGNISVCIKADGRFVLRNNQSSANGDKEYKGALRDCGTQANLALFMNGTANYLTNGTCYNKTIVGPSKYRNKDGSAMILEFQGQVCLCNSERCNGNGLFGASPPLLAAALVVAMFGKMIISS